MNKTTNDLLTRVLNIILIFSLSISLLGFLVDFRNTVNHGGADFRNRIVGARLLVKGIDPYRFKWGNGQDERLLDSYDDPKSIVSRVTVPPNVLLVYAPFVGLPYFHLRFGWLFFQWGALITSLLIFVKSELDPVRKKILWIVGLLFISGSWFWRLHVERGQTYILYVFLLSLAYWVLSKPITKPNVLDSRINISGVILIGLATSLRFPMIVMILAMILLRKIRLAGATLLSFCGFILASITISGWQVWENYFSAMIVFSKVNINLVEPAQNPIEVIIPKTIEGMTNLQSSFGFTVSDSSIQRLFYRLFDLSLQTNILITILCFVLLVYSLLIFIALKQVTRKSQISVVDQIFLIGTLMIMICDLFIPIARYSYNDIQLLIPLMLIFKNISFLKHDALVTTALLSTSFLTANGMLGWFPQQMLIQQYITIALMLGISVMLLQGTFVKQIDQLES